MSSISSSILFSAFVAALIALSGVSLGEVLINEVELNPPGNMPQWVELYNSGEGNVSIGGWTITIIDGPWKGPIKIPLGSVIQANQYLVLEGSTSWAQRNNGTALLVNSAGVEMDQTPQLNDEEDNDFTNSRVVDGFDTNTSADWAFMPGSKGRPNGAGLIKP